MMTISLAQVICLINQFYSQELVKPQFCLYLRTVYLRVSSARAQISAARLEQHTQLHLEDVRDILRDDSGAKYSSK